MPRYLVERTFSVAESEMPTVGKESREIAEKNFPEITWEHSHVVVDDNGGVRTYCIYVAPDRQTVLDHAAELGRHTVDGVFEISGDVTPADFPS
jgi:Nickel responsive protein SCO4226-like